MSSTPKALPTASTSFGQVVGYHTDHDVTGAIIIHGFVWDQGVTTDLGALPEFPYSVANGLNNQGQVVGTSSRFRSLSLGGHAFLWSRGVMSDLGTLPASTFSTAFRINNRGQIIGQSGTADDGNITMQHAVLWDR